MQCEVADNTKSQTGLQSDYSDITKSGDLTTWLMKYRVDKAQGYLICRAKGLDYLGIAKSKDVSNSDCLAYEKIKLG